MTDLLTVAAVIVTLHTNLVPVVTEVHHVEYVAHGTNVRVMVFSNVVAQAVPTPAPMRWLTNSAYFTSIAITNLVVMGSNGTNGTNGTNVHRVHKYTNLTGHTNGNTEAIGRMVPPKMPTYYIYRTNGVLHGSGNPFTNSAKLAPVPNVLSRSAPRLPPPLPGPMMEDTPALAPPMPPMLIARASALVVAGNRPICTNMWTAELFDSYSRMLEGYFVADYGNFTDGHTYQLQQAGSITGPWVAQSATVWDGGSDGYWRVAMETSGPQSYARQFVRFRELSNF